jgi:hypothetical protein
MRSERAIDLVLLFVAMLMPTAQAIDLALLVGADGAIDLALLVGAVLGGLLVCVKPEPITGFAAGQRERGV